MQLNAKFAPNFEILLRLVPGEEGAASKLHQLLTTTRALEEHEMFFRKPQYLKVAFEKNESVSAFPEGNRKFGVPCHHIMGSKVRGSTANL